MKGTFITLEGVEGTGKSTQLALIIDYLQSQGKQVLATREPGGTDIGERIRGILLAKDIEAMHADTELLLMYAARMEHIKKVIEPALQQGIWVVSDRFFDATYAYQGYGRGLDPARIDILNQFVVADIQPDLTLLLDVTLDVSEQRVNSRGQQDRFEEEKRDFFTKVREGYLTLASKDKKRIKVIDARNAIQQVQLDIRQCLDKLLNDE
jgi:dTMP kinase